jgi:NADH:ubiquinone oxidoreductase subunit F (NADH-binding)
MESARIAHYLAGQSAGQCGPCVYGLPAIADDVTRLARGHWDAGLMPRLERRLRDVNGRGACRHPDGAVGLVRSALRVFAADSHTHANGSPCQYADRPTVLRLPTTVGAAQR